MQILHARQSLVTVTNETNVSQLTTTKCCVSKYQDMYIDTYINNEIANYEILLVGL